MLPEVFVFTVVLNLFIPAANCQIFEFFHNFNDDTRFAIAIPLARGITGQVSIKGESQAELQLCNATLVPYGPLQRSVTIQASNVQCDNTPYGCVARQVRLRNLPPRVLQQPPTTRLMCLDRIARQVVMTAPTAEARTRLRSRTYTLLRPPFSHLPGVVNELCTGLP
jgi:hypothetical protein